MSLFIHLDILGPVPLKLECKVKSDGLDIFHQWGILHFSGHAPLSSMVSGPYSVPRPKHTPIVEWCVIRYASKN